MRNSWLAGYIFLGLSTPIVLNAQVPFENPKTYNTSNGLSSNTVLSIEKDAFGFAWIGTYEGLNRLDGNDIIQFFHDPQDSSSLANHAIIDLKYHEEDTVLWIAHMQGISTYNPLKRSIKNYYHNPDNVRSVPLNRCFKIQIDKHGAVWMGFLGGGLVRYNKETDDFDRFLCKGKKANRVNHKNCKIDVRDLMFDPNDEDVLWLAVNNDRIIKFNIETQAFISYQNTSLPIATGLTNFGNINTMYAHPNGKIYYNTWYTGTYVFDPEYGTFEIMGNCLPPGKSPPTHFVAYNMYPKSVNELWVSGNNSMLVLNTDENCFTEVFENKKDKTYNVSLIDDYGRIWSASREFGLQIYNPLQQQFNYHYFTPEDSRYNGGPQSIVTDPDGENLFVGAIEAPGLMVFNLPTQSWRIIPPPKDYDMANNGGFRLWDMELINDDELLISEDDSLYLYRKGSSRLEVFPIQPSEEDARLRQMVKDDQDRIWINSSETVRLLDLDKREMHDLRPELKKVWTESLGGRLINKDANGNIWIKDNYGILIYDMDNQKFIFHPSDEKKKNILRGIGPFETEANGDVWVATWKEYLAYCHADSLENGVLRIFSEDSGLIGQYIYHVKAYKDQLLIFTEKGVQFFDPQTQRFGAFYNKEYGMRATIHSSIALPDGRIVFGIHKGIGFFDPEKLKKNTELPKPYVAAFRVFDQLWDVGGLPLQDQHIDLSYKQNFFSIEFSAIGFNLPEGIRFRYMLKGFDQSWQDGTKRKFAAYTNVPGGDYQFIVEAINNEGLPSQQPSVTDIHISTVWWKTTWFWGLSTLIIIGVAYLLYRLRITQVLKEERLKSDYEKRLADVEMSALRAQMNPHFIFNSLNSIEYYIISNDPERASDYLNRFSRLIRLTLQNSKTTIVKLSDDLEALQLYVELESLRFDNLFDYEIKVEKDLKKEEVMVPPLLIQPYVENSIWHGLMQKRGDKGLLSVAISRRKNNLICYVEDNGIGREAAEKLKSKSATKRKSFGMKITKDRLDALNHLAGTKASVQIFDLKDDDGNATGTRVELVIPL